MKDEKRIRQTLERMGVSNLGRYVVNGKVCIAVYADSERNEENAKAFLKTCIEEGESLL